MQYSIYPSYSYFSCYSCGDRLSFDTEHGGKCMGASSLEKHLKSRYVKDMCCDALIISFVIVSVFIINSVPVHLSAILILFMWSAVIREVTKCVLA